MGSSKNNFVTPSHEVEREGEKKKGRKELVRLKNKAAEEAALLW